MILSIDIIYFVLALLQWYRRAESNKAKSLCHVKIKAVAKYWNLKYIFIFLVGMIILRWKMSALLFLFQGFIRITFDPA